MSASNKPLRVDQLARAVFGRAAEARAKGDAELALRVCAELESIASTYELRFRDGAPAAMPAKPRLLASKYSGTCAACGKGYAIGDTIRWTPGRATCAGCK